MKARPVPDLEPDGPLRDNARRIVAARVGEMLGFDPAIRDPAQIRALHDLRIAAKRVRYVLEVVGESLEPWYAVLEQDARDLQQLLGEIHDCDVLIPLVDDYVHALRAEDRAHLRVAAAKVAAAADEVESPEAEAEANDQAADAAQRRALATTPNRTCYRGLENLAAYLEARRERLYNGFMQRWDRLLASSWRERVDEAAS